MSQYLQMNCPQCQQELRVRGEYLNRRVSCKHCRHSFTVTGDTSASSVVGPTETPNLAPRVEALEHELRQAQTSLDAAQAERRTAAQELEQAQARLVESEAALEQVRQQVLQAATAAQQRDDALAELDRLRAEAELLKERAARADVLEKELEAERTAAAGQRSEWQASLATLKGQAETTEATLARVRGHRNRAYLEVRRLLGVVKEQEKIRQQRDQLLSDLTDARAGREQAASRVEAETRNVEELRSRLQAVQRSLEETTAGREQAHQVLTEHRQNWDAERAALHREWETKLLDQQQEAAEQIRRKGEETDRDRGLWEQQAEEAREHSQRQLAALEADIERLTQEGGEQQRQHTAALERVEGLVRERDRLGGRAEELERDAAEAERRWQGETTRLNEDLDALRRGQIELQHDLEEARGQLNRERAALTAEADEAHRQGATYREERDAALPWQAEAARLSSELDALGRRHAEIHQGLEESRGQFEAELLALRGEAGGLGEKLAEAQRRAEQLEKERDLATARGEEAEDRGRAEIRALAAELERAVQWHDEADRHSRDLQTSLEALGAEADCLRQSQAQLRKELSAREQEVESARDAAREAQDRLANARSNREDLEKAISSANQEQQRLQAELTRAKAEAAMMRQSLRSLGIVLG